MCVFCLLRKVGNIGDDAHLPVDRLMFEQQQH